MSRLGKVPIEMPSGVNIKKETSIVSVSGPKGSLNLDVKNCIDINVNNNIVNVELVEGVHKKFWGLYRTLILNMITGVSQGYVKKLELRGVGYKAILKGKSLELNLGFSHLINVDPPEGISFNVIKDTTIEVIGIDKQLVGKVAQSIRAYRKPEPYHGTGVRYVGEYIAQKVGKSSKK